MPEYGSGECTLKYIEAENLRITTGAARMPKYGSKVSGDSFSFMDGNSGKYTLALSDGMGTWHGASYRARPRSICWKAFLNPVLTRIRLWIS